MHDLINSFPFCLIICLPLILILYCYVISTFMFLLYCLLVLHCMIINISRQIKKFLAEWMTRLPCKRTQQLVGYCWVSIYPIVVGYRFQQRVCGQNPPETQKDIVVIFEELFSVLKMYGCHW